MTATLSLPDETKLQLKRKKLDIEEDLGKEITWEEFFDKINLVWEGVSNEKP